ncbi:hypothetical protein [Parasphingorhabdus sp.]|uniref:hypothetical protein n=1 Tax=Parasphingorhabdus sp. TaxID=2709688 RepID=UPI0032671AC9
MHFSLVLLASTAIIQPETSPENTRPAAEQEIAVPVVVEFKVKEKKKITDKRHPDYVRCRSRPVIGSLAKKTRVCMTNQEWKVANREGSKRSREMVEDLQVGMNNNGS